MSDDLNKRRDTELKYKAERLAEGKGYFNGGFHQDKPKTAYVTGYLDGHAECARYFEEMAQGEFVANEIEAQNWASSVLHDKAYWDKEFVEARKLGHLAGQRHQHFLISSNYEQREHLHKKRIEELEAALGAVVAQFGGLQGASMDQARKALGDERE